jgi:hypothetical protein
MGVSCGYAGRVDDSELDAAAAPATGDPARENAETLLRARGLWSGQIELADDFDELPADIAEAFGA